MTALISTVFVTSLVGSVHCAGMCGAVVALATCGPAGQQTARLHAAYHGGRLITYVLLGVAAGGLGALLDLSGPLLGLQRVAAVLAGLLMIGFGIAQVVRLAGVHLPAAPLPPFARSFVMWGHRHAMLRKPLHRALLLGLLTTLLPCGWLYAFAIAAAGTASPLWGGLTMAAFWAGTVPILAGLGLGLQRIGTSAGRWPALAGGIALVVVGGFTVLQRMQLKPETFQPAPVARTVGDVRQHVESIDPQQLPCCQHDQP